MARYKPSAKPSSVESLLPHVIKELDRISEAINSLADGYLEVQNAAPIRPRQGYIRYADGTNWNPGSGEGIYFYNAAGSWVKL